MSAASAPRLEIKFVLPPAALADVERWLRTAPGAFSPAFPPRQVNSIYFDDPNFSAVGDNLDGITPRQKLRLRWYGSAPFPTEASTLEVKIKHGQLGSKRAWPLGPRPFAGRRWRDILADLRSEVAGLGPLLEGDVHASLLVRYQRRYLESADGNVRLTVDTDLRFHDQRLAISPSLSRAVPVPDMVVIEAKVATGYVDQLVPHLGRLGFRQTRFSKYVYGLIHCREII